MPSVRNLRKLKLSSVDLVPKGSNPGAHIALFKEAPDDASVDTSETPNLQDEVKTSPEETNMSTTETPTQAVETPEVEAEVETTEETTAEAATTETEATETPATEAATEATPELVGAGVEKAEAESIRKELDEARAEIAKMQADARHREFVAKAQEFKPLGDTEKIAVLLEKADTHFDADEVKQLTRLLKAAVAQAETGDLFAQFGKTDADPEGREQRLEKAAQERVAKGESKTIEQARVAVMDADPELRPDYSVRS